MGRAAQDGEVARQSETLHSVNRALDVIEAFTPERPTWGLSALARELGIGKATLHRLLRNLEERGYVRQDADSRLYRLGFRPLQVGQAAIAETPSEIAHHHLRELSRSVGEQVTLWVLDDDHAVCIDKVAARNALRTHTELGAREPAALLASGRCLLAGAGEDPAVPDTVLPTGERLADRLVRIRANGYDISLGDRWPDVCAIGVPIRDHTGAVVAAVAISGARTRLDEQRLQQVATHVIEAAAAISADLGAPRP